MIILDEQKKQRTDTKVKKLRLITIALQGAIEKSPILLSQYWNNGKFNSTL